MIKLIFYCVMTILQFQFLNQIQLVKQHPAISSLSLIAEEKALLKNGDAQSVVNIKGVDDNFSRVSGVPSKLTKGSFKTGTAEHPELVIGAGVQYAAGITVAEAFAPDMLTIILPKKTAVQADPYQSLSEGNATASAVFAIQEDFDNKYAITNIGFVKQQMGLGEHEYTAAEIKLKDVSETQQAQEALQQLLGINYQVKTKYEQNSNLYNTMKLEKWAIYAVLTLILIIAAFNMVSALTMLVLEKKQDIAILKSMGSPSSMIRRIFLSEGLLLASIGAVTGISLAIIICLLQVKYKLIKLQGGTFLIDYFPVKLVATDFLLVAGTAMAIAILASWFPAFKASRQPVELR